MFRFFFTFSLILLTGAHLHGQSDVVRNIKVSVFSVAYAEGHQTIYLTNSKGEASEIRLSTANIRGPYKTVLDADSNVTLRTKAKSEEGATIYPPIAQIKIPGNIKEPLMILVPSSGKQPYRALIIERSLDEFPNGSYTLINFSPMDIRGLVGKTQVIAPLKKITSFNPSSSEDRMLKVHFQYKRTDDWETFVRTKWANKRNKRTLLLAYPDPKTKRMKIKGIPVRPPPQKRKKE
jgi:hypothetical protein